MTAALLVTACSGEPEGREPGTQFVVETDLPVALDDADPGRRIMADATLAQRSVLIDFAPLEADAADGLALELPLGDGRAVTLVVERLDSPVAGVQTYSGRVEGTDDGLFVLSREGEALLGTVEFDGEVWIVQPQADAGLHSVRQLDRGRIPRPPGEDVISPADGPRGPGAHPATIAAPNDASPTCASNGEVRVLFLHASNVPSAASLASNIVTQFNQSTSASDVAWNNYVSVAGVVPIASTFAGMSRVAIMGEMANRSGVFANIDALMAANYADVAFLLVNEESNVPGEWPQWGRVGGAAYRFDQSRPFAMSTDDYALGDLTALHELGHIFGGYDDTLGSGICRSVVRPDLGWMTMMGAYNTPGCEFNGLNSACERLARWSNPAQTWYGGALGVVGQSDMESCLEQNMPTVSNWAPCPPPPPPAPASLTKQPEYCFGFNTLSWSAVAGATHYELYRSTSSWFGSPVLLSSGSSTSRFVNVTSGTWYFRVKACNAGGCSGYSPQTSATRLGYCL